MINGTRSSKDSSAHQTQELRVPRENMQTEVTKPTQISNKLLSNASSGQGAAGVRRSLEKWKLR